MIDVGLAAVDYGGTRKSAPDTSSGDRLISRQLDELQRISDQERDKILGKDYFTDIESFYALDDEETNQPLFHPRVIIPQLQTLVLNEATDITDSSPKIYITRHGQRDKEREEFFQSNWRQGSYNNRILEAFIWAMLSNLGYLQVGFDPYARRGAGTTWLQSRNPKSVHPDPYATSSADWSFVGWTDLMYLDEVHRRWPDRAYLVRPRASAASDSDPVGGLDQQLDFPEKSPLSVDAAPVKKMFRQSSVRVRTFFLFDNTRERVKDYAGSQSEALGLIHPRFQYKYPDGRWITEAEGIVLADGPNWCPQLPDDQLGTFPLIRLSAMPCVTNFWGPPPVKLSRSLQNVAERMHMQAFENMFRLNNGVIVIEDNSGLTVDGFGWLPGEVLMIHAGSKPPQVINPQAFTEAQFKAPMALLALQKELQGFTQARQGQASAGNISADLYDATLWSSQPQTRMRARLLSESLQRLAQIVFYVNARYQRTAHRTHGHRARRDHLQGVDSDFRPW